MTCTIAPTTYRIASAKQENIWSTEAIICAANRSKRKQKAILLGGD
ncbi:MAG: hypothetical protein LBF27_22250 [Sphingobacterium sp.]|nr:hypothetical protein [Sphingobacterium sp.]